MPAPKKVSLEACFEKIDAVIEQLEAGELPLEQAFKQYEVGIKNIGAAKAQLDAYQARFEELRGNESSNA